ncbi:MAG: HupE/UreJ family protein [Thermodesulfobacteriota bacterium]
MKSIKIRSLLAFSVSIFLLPACAYAHTGFTHGSGFLSGLNHPMGGFDHILAIAAVGIWVSQVGGKALWAVPAAFVGAMLLGCFLGISGLTIPFIEVGIIGSVLIFGILIALAAPLPLAAGMAMAGLFALFHGQAHGAQMPLSTSALAYGAGLVAATALLHLGGIVTGLLLQKRGSAQLIRNCGAVIALAGVYMFLA